MNPTVPLVLISILVLSTARPIGRPSRSAVGSQAMRIVGDKQGWAQCTGFPFHVWLGWVSTKGSSRVSRTALFFLLESEYFTRENLIKIFRRFSDENSTANPLEITIYSDEMMLKRAIQLEKNPVNVEFLENEKGRRDQIAYAQRYSAADKGYFRAYYVRVENKELFRYSTDPQSDRYTWIDMKAAPKEDPVMMLIEAVKFGDVQIAQTLIAQGANRDVRAQTGNGLIRHLPKRNKELMIGLLISAGENFNERDEYSWTPLMRAASAGDRESSAILLKSGAEKEARNNEGKTALLIAAQQQHPEVIELLLERGCDKDKTDKTGQTALMFAAMNGDLRGIRALLLKGSDPNARNKEGRTALFVANAETPGLLAALIDAGGDVNAKDRNDETALMRAVDSHELPKSEELLKMGADARLRNGAGRSALDIAKRRWGPDDEITKLLEAASREK